MDKEMSFSIGSKFIVGVNQGWFGGKYDNDLGFNQFSIGRLYRPNIPDPSLPDPNPAMPYVSSHPEEIANFFQRVTSSDGGENPNFSNSAAISTLVTAPNSLSEFSAVSFWKLTVTADSFSKS